MKSLLFLVLFVFQGAFSLPLDDAKDNYFESLQLQEPSDDCNSLTSVVLTARNDVSSLSQWMPGLDETVESIEEFVNFPFTSDRHWKRLACDIAAVTSLDGLVRVLNDLGRDHPITGVMLSNFLAHMKSIYGDAKTLWPEYKAFFVQASDWMIRTGYPDVWPLSNTNRYEVQKLLERAVTIEYSLMFFISSNEETIDEATVTSSLIESKSLAEYLTRIGKEEEVGSEALKRGLYMLRNMKNKPRLGEMMDTSDHLRDLLQATDDLGILDLKNN